MGGMPSPPVTAHTLFTSWQGGAFAAGVAVALLLAAVVYLMGTRKVAGRGRHWPVSRTVSFLLGLVSVELALGSSVAVLAMSRFESHIVQHLLLMVVGPPLLALGAPMTLALQTVSRPTKRTLLRILHSRPFGTLSHPITVFFLYYLSMYAFFLSGALGYAMDHMWLMDIINLGFLAGATLFWWPMVGLDPIPRWRMGPAFKLVNLLIGIPVEAFLGIALLMKTSPAAPMYTLASTHAGGGILWAASELATVIALVPIFVQWTRADERAGRRINARLDAGQAVTVAPMEGHGLAASLRVMRRD